MDADGQERRLSAEPSRLEAGTGIQRTSADVPEDLSGKCSPVASSKEYLADIDDESQRKLISRVPVLDRLHRLGYQLTKYKVEKAGIAPLPDAERIQTAWWQVGVTWFPVNFNVLSFSAGTLTGPVFGLGMYGALFTILGFCAICSIPPALLTIWGPKLGMRQLVITRLMLGFLPATIFGILNMCGMLGYSILNSILGGQTLSAVANANDLTPTVGIVIMVIVALLTSFCGIKVVHFVDQWSWIPVLVAFITFIAMAGTGPNGLHIPAGPDPSTVRGVLGMGSVIAGFLISYSGLASDYSLYLRPETPRFKLFLSTFLAFFVSTTSIMMLGAAFAISAQDIPAWSNALEISNGALFDIVMGENPALSRAARGFGKFCTAILALSTIPNLMITFYSFGLTFQTTFSLLLAPLPRFIMPIVAAAIILPLAIVGQTAFYETLEYFSAIIGYAAGWFASFTIVEHYVVRRGDWSRYDRSLWNDWRRLPIGIGSIAAALLSCFLLVPTIDQHWYTGPIAVRAGDLGFEVTFFLGALLYLPCRLAERALTHR